MSLSIGISEQYLFGLMVVKAQIPIEAKAKSG